jgi:mono/diheme cytochrome c family protein
MTQFGKLGTFLAAGMLTALAPSPAPAAPATFNRDVAPILFENCVSCHRPGEVAPFSLLTYADARRHAKEIAELTAERQMPPWKAAEGFGAFVGARRISDQQIQTIQQWVKDGKPEGSPSDVPPAPKFTDGWTLGEPDLIVKMPQAYTLRADPPDDYRVFVIPLNLTEDKYVRAVDFRPSNRKIVHHSLFFLDTSGQARELEAQAADHKPGYFRVGGPGFRPSGGLGGWAPGVLPRLLPDGVGRPVRAGSDLIIQTHFHPSGKVESEQSAVGLYFAKQPPQKVLLSIPHGNNSIDIEPGDRHYVIDDSFTLPAPVELQGIIPHAHLLCRQIKVTATLPDGTVEPLIWVRDWDWNWQEQYQYARVLRFPRGTKVRQEFFYDNSTENAHNPNTPPRRVRYGEQTGDEMALVFYQILLDRRTAEFAGPLRQMLSQRRNRPTTNPTKSD